MAGASRYLRGYATADVIINLAREGLHMNGIMRGLALPYAEVERVVLRAVRQGQLTFYPPREASPDAEVKALRQRCAELAAEVEEWRQVGIPPEERNNSATMRRLRALFDMGLTGKEAQLADFLLHRAEVTSAPMIYRVLYANALGGGPDPKVINLMLHRVRQKLRPLGVEIVSQWGKGYSLPPASAARLRDLITTRSAATTESED